MDPVVDTTPIDPSDTTSDQAAGDLNQQLMEAALLGLIPSIVIKGQNEIIGDVINE